MKVFGIAGWSGSGKTTLLVQLIPLLVERGIEVATIKHTHHIPAVGDAESAALAAAGATETVVASATGFAILHELQGAPEPSLDDLAARLGEVDLVLVEGFKYAAHPKIEVWHAPDGKPPLAPVDPSIVAVACDGVPPVSDRPAFDRADAAGIAAFILDYCAMA